MTSNEVDNVTILTQAALTGATATSAPVRVGTIDNLGFQVTWSAGSGSPAGTCSVEASNDGTNYGVLTLSATPTISGNSGTLLIGITQFPFSWVRVKVTMTVGQIDVFVKYSGEQI